MKVMQVMPEFGLAGAEIMCENLMVELKNKNIDVFGVSLYDYKSAITERLEDKQIRVIYLDKKPGLDLTIYKKLYKIIKSEKPDVIHTHRYVMQYVVPIAKLCKIKTLIHTVHNIATKEQEKSKRKLSYFFYHFMHVTPVALSEEVKQTIIDEYKLKEEYIPVIYNGEDISRFKRKQSYVVEDTFKLIHIGRFMEAKNHLCLLEAIKELLEDGHDIKLECIGDFSTEIGQECISYVKENNIDNRIVFQGLKNDVFPYLNAADCFILPSLFEGMPMVIIEAMACGLPIIASKVGGIGEMITNLESGLLILPNKEEIKKSIIILKDDYELRSRLGINAHNRSQIFSSQNMAAKYIEIYKLKSMTE